MIIEQLIKTETDMMVIKSLDYFMFKTLQGNRIVNKLHVKRLVDSFRKSYLISPIIVNEKYEIIDGQHRFEAAKLIGLPIYYIIAQGYGLKEVQMLNENMKNWKKVDYLNTYCDLKYPEYLKFRNFMNRFPDFGISTSESILTNSLSLNSKIDKNLISSTNKRGIFSMRYFQEGSLKIPDYEKSIINAEKIIDIKPYYLGYNRSAFVRAMMGIFRINDYNHGKLLKRLNLNPMSIEHCSTVTQYKLLIEEIYNFRSRNKISLRF